MRGVTIELPAAAAAKLAELNLQRDAALDAMRSCAQRANNLPRDGADQLRSRLAQERDRFAERHQMFSRVVNKLHQWISELRLPPGAVLEVAAPPAVRLKASETIVVALANVRIQIADIQAQIAAVRRLPLTRASELAAIRAHLARLPVRPRLVFDVRGNASITFLDDIPTMGSVLGLLAHLLGAEEITAALARDLAAEPVGAVSPLEREAQIDALAAKLYALEQTEQSLIDGAAAEGVEVAYRADCDPRCVLGVAVVRAPSASAA